MSMLRLWLVLIAPVFFLSAAAQSRAEETPVSFSRDIRHLIADKCFACHGPDSTRSDVSLRLDLRDAVFKQDDTGHAAIVPKQPDRSEVIRRIFSDDPAERMPPPDSKKQLSVEQRFLIKRWIAEGATFEDHWAFVPPRRPPVPAMTSSWPRNEIDRFVLAKLDQMHMAPSPEANRHALIRRVSLDVRGLPPTLDEIDAFVNDNSSAAYERMVDRMLASPHYGEKMARLWLDLGRYGDTTGYQSDSTRQTWLWRDWVINAYNANMPFDRFTIEQLAGDLLSDPSTDQKIATGFNRNTRFNEESGSDPDEFLVTYVKDRVNTLGKVWLGLSLGCAECHNHKYDPISQKEYYQLFAYFNNLDEQGAEGHNEIYRPVVQAPSQAQRETLAKLDQRIKECEQPIEAAVASFDKQDLSATSKRPQEGTPREFIWIDDDPPLGASLVGDGVFWIESPEPVHSGRRSMRRTNSESQRHQFVTKSHKLSVGKGDELFAWVYLGPDMPRQLMLQFNLSGEPDAWTHRVYWGEDLPESNTDRAVVRKKIGPLPEKGKWIKLRVPAETIDIQPGTNIYGVSIAQNGGTGYWDDVGILTSVRQNDDHHYSLADWDQIARVFESVPAKVKEVLSKPSKERSADEQSLVRHHFVEYWFAPAREVFQPLHAALQSAQEARQKEDVQIPFQLVSVELPKPRPSYVLTRGDFQQHGEQVTADVPAVLPRVSSNEPQNRLGLARWLTHPNHPLVARVTVNRYWAQLFGKGIVKTIADFGAQGQYPSHPELLDWLAIQFVESGWDTKSLLKTLLMSATYRQSSVHDGRFDAIDPNNDLLSRATRFRLDAEEIRDSAFTAAGILSRRIGGPSVFPFQPPDFYNGKASWKWDVSPGEDKYRRGHYTFWRRTTPFPAFTIFDAPDRCESTVERPKTNTPLQALVTLNDPQFVEAAFGLADRILTNSGPTPDDRLRYAMQAVVGRAPTFEELGVLQELLKRQVSYYEHNAPAAQMLADNPHGIGLSKGNHSQAAERAAWTVVSNVLLNLDEAITRQ